MDRHKFDLWLESLLPKTVELHSNAVCTELKRENGGFLISYQDLQTKQIRTFERNFSLGRTAQIPSSEERSIPKSSCAGIFPYSNGSPKHTRTRFIPAFLIRKQQIAVRGRFPRIISLFSAVPFLWIMPENALNGKRQSWRKSGFVSARP